MSDISRELEELTKAGKTQKAIEKCKKHLDNKKVLSYYIKLLANTGKIEEAKELCKKNQKDLIILNQFIIILMNEGNYDEARRLCEKYSDQEEIISVYIHILDHFNEKDKIKELSEKYPYNILIAEASACHFYKVGKYDDVVKIYEKHPFDKYINKLYEKIVYPDDYHDYITNRNKTKSEEEKIYTKVKELITNNKMKDAKKLCRQYIDDSNVFDLYLMILEKERINEYKKTI